SLNGAPTCSNGSCAWTCNMNFAHCASGNTGCETPTNDVSNCGGCGNVCMPDNATANMGKGTQCSYTCMTGFADCLKVGADTDGCETPANDLAHCGGCAPCDTAQSMGANCVSSVCQYSGCQPGYIDCDQTPPNTNGCECSTPMCCGAACQPVHSNGLGQTYLLMCVALGTPGNAATYTVAMATAAQQAWPAGTDSTKTCGNGSNAAACVTRTGASTCAVWCYTKVLAGHVFEAPT